MGDRRSLARGGICAMPVGDGLIGVSRVFRAGSPGSIVYVVSSSTEKILNQRAGTESRSQQHGNGTKPQHQCRVTPHARQNHRISSIKFWAPRAHSQGRLPQPKLCQANGSVLCTISSIFCRNTSMPRRATVVRVPSSRQLVSDNETPRSPQPCLGT